jgi:hypothetical protein
MDDFPTVDFEPRFDEQGQFLPRPRDLPLLTLLLTSEPWADEECIMLIQL